MNNPGSLKIVALSLFIATASQAGGGRDRVVGGETVIEPKRGEITVDGRLDEWERSRATMLTLFRGGEGEGDGAFNDYGAQVQMRHDEDALYLAVWWRDPTPMGREQREQALPPGDGLILHAPVEDEVRHLALWSEEGSSVARLAVGRQPLAQAEPAPAVKQAFRKTDSTSYTQEVRIPWDVLGGQPQPGTTWRIAFDLCFGGLNPKAGYEAWLEAVKGAGKPGNRFGGGMTWGFVDGLQDLSIHRILYNPDLGATVRLEPAGAEAPPNPPVMFMGREKTRTTDMIALPATDITVDGKLTDDEWSAAASTTLASEPGLFPNRYATDIHWAYDEEGLYMGLRWRTGGERLNINDPEVINRGYDGGDALQIRLRTDRTSHVDAWYWDAGNQPAMAITYGRRFGKGTLDDALAEGARLAIHDPDGPGYTQELFLPWDLITQDGTPLTEGDRFKTIFSLFYSGLEGNRIPYILNTRVALPTGVVAVPMQTPREGYYTAVIETPEGDVVRRLLAHAGRSAGDPLEQWDGLTDHREVAPPGEYRFRGLHHTGLGLEYLMSYNQPGRPPWQNTDGTGEWGGDHSAPQDVLVLGDALFLAWPSAEDGTGLIRIDEDGQKHWGNLKTPHGAAAGGIACLAHDDELIYFANEGRQRRHGRPEIAYWNTVITAFDPVTGRRRGFSLAKPKHELAEHPLSAAQHGWWWDVWQDRNFSLDTAGIRDDYYWSNRVAGGNLAGLAAQDGRLYVSLRLENAVVVFDTEEVEEVRRIAVHKPGGLHIDADGRLLAVADRQVVRIDPETGEVQPLVTEGLEAPVDLTVDDTGAIYVSDWGNAQCVRVFDGKTGDLLRTIGTPGGRPWLGPYDPDGMLMPRGLDIDPQNRLWIAEDDNQPRRISVWDAKSGTLIREFIGGTTYGGANGGNQLAEDIGYSLDFLFRLDLDEGTSQPLATADRRVALNDVFNLLPRWAPYLHPVEYKGRRFLVTNHSGEIQLGELDENYRWKPYVAVGSITDSSRNPKLWEESRLGWRNTLHPAFYRKYAGHNYLWMDENGNGLAEEEEYQWRKHSEDFGALSGGYWGLGTVGDDLTIYAGLSRFPLQGWSEDGRPLYDLDQHHHTPLTHRYAAITVDGQGNILTSVGGGATREDFTPGIHSHRPDGELNWWYPTSLDVKAIGKVTGEALLGPVDAGGEVGEIFSLTQWHGRHVPLLTTDGLYLGRVLRHAAEGGGPGPDVWQGETIQVLSELPDGRIILSHGKNAHHLFEITGLDTVQRFEGAFTLTEEQAESARRMLNKVQEAEEDAAPIPMIRLDQPLSVDGDLSDWMWARAVSIGGEEAPKAEVALAHHEDRVYLAFDVDKGGDEYRNTGQDWRRLFITGDAVDVHYGLDPAADPDRKKPVVGDRRLLFGRRVLPSGEKKAVAVLYRASVPGTEEPVLFSSPARDTRFDDVRLLEDAEVVIVDTEQGYRVEAAVPTSDFADIHLWPERILRGDAGIIVADETSRRSARIYRFNPRTHVINDVPTEAALVPHAWGEIEVDRLK